MSTFSPENKMAAILLTTLWNAFPFPIVIGLAPNQCLVRSGMMTSSNGNIFRVTGALCGEFTGHRWILRTKASDAELWCFLWSAAPEHYWVNNREACDLRRHRAHYDGPVRLRLYAPPSLKYVYQKTHSLLTMQLRMTISPDFSLYFFLGPPFAKQ